MDWKLAILCLALSHPTYAFIKYGFKFLAQRSMQRAVSQALADKIDQRELMEIIDRRMAVVFSRIEVTPDGKVARTDTIQHPGTTDIKEPH